jgi:hypothetical protein
MNAFANLKFKWLKKLRKKMFIKRKKNSIALALVIYFIIQIYSIPGPHKGLAKQAFNVSEFKQSNCYQAFTTKNINTNVKLEPHPACLNKDWVIIHLDATLTYNDVFLTKAGITIRSCSYQTISWSQDDFHFAKSDLITVMNGSRLDVNEDFFQIKCESTNGLEYSGVFARVFKPKFVHNPNRQPINVMMLGLDSVSRDDWLTYLSKTSDFFLNQMNGTTVLNGYNIMGDGTPAALIPVS